MPDYIYLLDNRLSADQQNALRHLRDVAREAEMILFLTGDAVRDLTSGHAVRELEVAVQGNALKLKKLVQRVGAKIWGEDETSKSLYLCFPGTVRIDVISTHRVEYKKPGQPIFHAAGIQDDLRRRDFTMNAMAISLNEGSYGLLMDPLNGVADIETRTIRMVSNYGFIEDPSLLIRAIRYRTRLSWELDARTQVRYDNAKEEGTIQYLSAHARSRELEQIGHEDEGLKVLQALETEGWMKILCPAWTHSKADLPKLNTLHDLSVELLMQGVHADISAAQMQLLTAKMTPKDLSSLKKSLLRPGFVEEWNNLDHLAAEFAKVLTAKENQPPSAMYKLFTSYDPEAVLWLGFTTKDSGIRQRYTNFLKVWPEMRQQIPYALMLDMRIRPELPNYNDIVHAIFLQLIDGKLATPEEMRIFLEPYSPPAPPPPVTIKRTRAKRVAEPKVKEVLDEEEEEESSGEDEDDMGEDEEDIGLGMSKMDMESEEEEEEEEEGGDEEEEPVPAKRGKAAAKPAKATLVPVPAKPELHAIAPKTPEKTHTKTAPKPAVQHQKPSAKAMQHPAKKTTAKAVAKAPVKKAALKPVAKPVHKSVPKVASKKVDPKPMVTKSKAKPTPRLVAKGKSAKPVAKKPMLQKLAHKPAKKR